MATPQRHNWTTASRGWEWKRILLTIFISLLVGSVLAHGYLIASLFFASNPQPNTTHQQRRTNQGSANVASSQRSIQKSNLPKNFQEWKQLAMNLARLPPDQVLQNLATNDPFGVRNTTKMPNRNVQLCHHRISSPDQRNHTASQRFRDGHGMIFFQHLRKAGGTHFCSLAEANFERRHLPRYYCMPDYDWEQPQRKQKCAGCLHSYSAQYIMDHIRQYRILGNEWDSFDTVEHWKLVDTVYVTSFRSPMDRAVSQFRFECAEQRGCHETNMTRWWERRRDLYNIYTRTFADVQRQARMVYGEEFAAQRAAAVGAALDTLARFHLVLHMEYLSESSVVEMLQTTLGFTNVADVIQKRVRPHNQKISRQDSWSAQSYLTPEQYRWMQPTLALDEIVTDAARRMFFERALCDSNIEERKGGDGR